MDNLNLNQLNNDELILNSCAHRTKDQFQKCELTLNSHFTNGNLLNLCPINSSILNSNDKIIQPNQCYSNYQLNNQDFSLDQSHLLRDIYLNQIILPEQELNKFQVFALS